MLIPLYTVNNYLCNAIGDKNICKHVFKSFLIYMKKYNTKMLNTIEYVKRGWVQLLLLIEKVWVGLKTVLWSLHIASQALISCF